MHITFFVGNGFDISCGISSSYSDFYKWYYKQKKSDKQHVNDFRADIEKDINEGKNHWADFEEALGKYTQNFSKDTAQDFIDCFEDAHSNLMKYLESELARFEEEFSDEAIKIFRKGINTFYAELNPKEKKLIEDVFTSYHNESSSVEFVSYNYTNVLDKAVSVAAKEPLKAWTNVNGKLCTLSITQTVIHAHGLLDYHPIFGVNDDQQILNKELLEVPDFSRLMVKPKCVEAFGEFWHDEIDARISNSSIICIYGMSLGITDSIWFQKIMSWLKSNNTRHLIIFWHNNDPTDGRSIWQPLTNTRKVKEKIIGFSNYSRQQIDEIENRIHVIENTKNVLQIKLKEKSEEE